MSVKGPGMDDNDGSESASERPWTLSMAGSWTSIMVVKRRERDGGWRRRAKSLRGGTWSPRECHQ